MARNVTNTLGQPVGWPVTVERPRAHAAELFQAYNAAADDGDWTYLSYGPFAEVDEFTAFAEQCARKSDPVFFTVVEHSSGRCLGLASFLRIDPYAASIEVGHIHFGRPRPPTSTSTQGERRSGPTCDDKACVKRRSWAKSRRSLLRLQYRYRETTRRRSRLRTCANPFDDWEGDCQIPGVTGLV